MIFKINSWDFFWKDFWKDYWKDFWKDFQKDFGTITIFLNGKDYNGKLTQNSWGQDIQRMLGTQIFDLIF